MDAYEKKTGGRVLAIPHNANVSNGLMFELTQAGRRPMTAPTPSAAPPRAAGRDHPDQGRQRGASVPFAQRRVRRLRGGWESPTWRERRRRPTCCRGNYVREALKRGLRSRRSPGINPYKFGLIGAPTATPVSHCGENNFFGKHRGNEPSPTRGSRGNPGHETGTARRLATTSPAAMPGSGRRPTPARRSSTRWRGARSTPPPARG